jgi:predicted phosphodiesterase
MSKKPLKLNKSAAVVSRWTKVMALGCSHGKHICPKAKASVLEARAKFKPDRIIHLGDAMDTSAFRSGARGIDADSAEPVAPDIDGGLMFLRELKADTYLFGNHEARLTALSNSPNAVIAYASGRALYHIEEECAKMGTRIIPYDGIYQKVMIGDVMFTHGTFYNEMAARDMAEAYGGKVVFAHTHRAMQAPGRTMNASHGYCVGTLTRKREMTYASCRRATMGWGMGLVCAEIREGRNPVSQVWLFTGPSEGEDHGWRLPF